MELAGTIVNGQVRLDQPVDLPDGTRGVFLLDEEDDLPPPPPTETHAQYIAGLQESIDDMKAGRMRPAREILKEIALRHGLPLEPGE